MSVFQHGFFDVAAKPAPHFAGKNKPKHNRGKPVP